MAIRKSGFLARSLATLAACSMLSPAAGHAQAPAPQAVTAPAPAAETTRPNILLIMADDLNVSIGAYGGPARTPNIDRLATEGVTFDRAYSQFPWCGPSRASFLTGTRPNTNGVFNLSTPLRARLPGIVTLPQYFRQNGYYTARVGKIFHQGVPGGMGRDGADDPEAWDERFNPAGCDTQKLDQLTNLTPGIPLGSALSYLKDDCSDANQTDGQVAEKTIALLEKASRDGGPFFISAGFYRPHVPEIVPKAYFDLYKRDDIAVSSDTAEQRDKVLPAAKTTYPDHYGMTAEEQRDFILSYYAAVSFMDAQVGRILKAVEQLGLADDTIVVFTSDHGFLLGEHGQWQKQLLFEGSARVPLIIRVPGARSAGRHSPRTVEMLDIYPTLTELAGLSPNVRNEGTSLVPLLADPADTSWSKPALTQVSGGRSVRTERYRYTEWENGKSGRELYDHLTDPQEQVNLVDDPRYAGAVELLRGMLPPGPVEPLPTRSRYDPDADCFIPSSRYTRPGRPDGGGASERTGGAPGAGDGTLGLKLCDLQE